jgi:hypothetical protein
VFFIRRKIIVDSLILLDSFMHVWQLYRGASPGDCNAFGNFRRPAST